jgi:hypothetical protein
MNMLLAAVLVMQDPSVDHLLEKFRSDQVGEREHAERELRKLGEAAVAGLEKATGDKDAEVAHRARECLNRIRYESGTRILKKVEETVAKARTLQLKLSSRSPSPKEPSASDWEVTGEILFKEGNKFSISTQTVAGHGMRVESLCSDGSQFARYSGSLEALRGSWGGSRRDYKGDLLPCVIAAGSWVTAEMLDTQLQSKAQGSPDASRPFHLYDFKEGREGGAGTLTYVIDYDPRWSAVRPLHLRATLSYELATWRPLKRTFQYALGRSKEVAFDALEEFLFDADIPDEKFQVLEDRFKQR